MFLNCIIGQMDHSILQIFGCELLGSSANIAFFVPVASKVSSNGCNQHITSYVELTLVVKKGHEVTLHDV